MNEQIFSSENINRRVERAKLPKILWVLGFNSWSEFKSEVEKTRISQKQEQKKDKELLSGVCRKIIGKKWISNKEYEELKALVKKELDKIKKTIDDAKKMEDDLDVKNLIIPETTSQYKKRIAMNIKNLRADHEI